MDDIAGLNWNSRSGDGSIHKPSYAFPILKPTPPTSGRASPLNATQSNASSKPGTPAIDSFSNLVPFSATSSNKNISLQEQQKRLGDLKLQQQAAHTKNVQDHFAGGDDNFWNNLGSGRSTPAAGGSTQKNGTVTLNGKDTEEEEDIFASLNATSKHGTGKLQLIPSDKHDAGKYQLEDDDDPFGLSEFQARNVDKPAHQSNDIEDDDVLGLLGKPVSSKPQPLPQDSINLKKSKGEHPQDKAVAELVDMGFSTEKARQALETTDSGMDVQTAVGWLLNQAHSEARQRSQGRPEIGKPQDVRDPYQSAKWQQRQQDDDSVSSQRREGSSRSTRDRDPIPNAADFRNNFLKTAGSLWKEGTKKVQQVVQEFNSDSESGQPKWMRSELDAKLEDRPQRNVQEAGIARQRRRSSGNKVVASVTEEALMLETSRPTQPTKRTARPINDPRFDSSADSPRDHSPSVPSRLRDSLSSQPPSLHQRQQAPPSVSAKPILTRQAVEEQAAQAYVSSARRRKPASQPLPSHSPPVEEPNLFEEPVAKPNGPKSLNSVSVKPITTPSVSTSTKSAAISPRLSPQSRKIPSVSPTSLKASHLHREKGNEHFKRGDYSSAHQSYTQSVSHLPAEHPITIVLLTNRALTSLKIGEPKTAVLDSDRVISLIGPSKGDSETIDLINGQTPKPMREYYGKALMRKAEALEQMEKWADAATVWREAVEGGHGGSTSIQGRIRAEKAANPEVNKSKPATIPKQVVKSNRPSALQQLNGHRPNPGSESSDAAVNRLRAANAAAEKADDEKFALSDAVEARIVAWKGTRTDNLRALLSSLDSVLWPEAGWKKISMADLVLPGKVKIQYMKGIAKVHPDKISTDATTEQRMIAGAVFSTLNEAWEKFKTENGL